MKGREGINERERINEREGIKEREDGERGGLINRGRRIFLMFPSKGADCSREAINRGTANVLGNTVY